MFHVGYLFILLFLICQFEFEHGEIRYVSETTLPTKIITNQINQQGSILSQKSKIKMSWSKRSSINEASNMKTQNNVPTSSSDKKTQASLALNNMES